MDGRDRPSLARNCSREAFTDSDSASAKVSSPPPFALERWGFATGGDDEEEVKKKEAGKKRAPVAKRSSTGAKGKEKYLVSPAAPPEAAAAGQGDHPEFMSGTDPGLGDDDVLPSSFDPFADARAEDAAAGSDEYVHLRVQQRNGKKTLTTVQGLSAGYNYAKVLRDLKKELCCNGTVVEDKELGKIIQLQGDHRKSVAGFLARAGMVKKDNVKVHGF